MPVELSEVQSGVSAAPAQNQQCQGSMPGGLGFQFKAISIMATAAARSCSIIEHSNLCAPVTVPELRWQSKA